MAIVSIKYNECGKYENLGYESVVLSYGDNKKEFFNSGDFVKDWFNFTRFVVVEEIPNKEFVCYSSSVDHFIMDGAKVDSAYLHFEGDVPILKYIDKSDEKWFMNQQDIYEKCIEIFVDEGTTPTWNELRVRCGHEPLK